jgi:hypothetical protein
MKPVQPYATPYDTRHATRYATATQRGTQLGTPQAACEPAPLLRTTLAKRALLLWAGLCLTGLQVGLQAQTLRDPTESPIAAEPTPSRSGQGSANNTPFGKEGASSVMVRNGVPYLVVDSRLYGKGQKIGAYTVERISETEIWLRQGSTLLKTPRFTGITRKTSTANAPCSSSAPKAAPPKRPNHPTRPEDASNTPSENSANSANSATPVFAPGCKNLSP